MNSPVSVSTMAIVCCFACRSQPTIFISASFGPSLLVGYRKVYSGRRGADVVMSSATPVYVNYHLIAIPPRVKGIFSRLAIIQPPPMFGPLDFLMLTQNAQLSRTPNSSTAHSMASFTTFYILGSALQNCARSPASNTPQV